MMFVARSLNYSENIDRIVCFRLMKTEGLVDTKLH